MQLSIYLNTETGCDDKSGKDWDNAVKTMAEALKKVPRSGTITCYGKIVEDGLVTPAGITDVTIIGHAPRPREGNHGRAAGPKGGASDWRYNSGNEPLLHVTQQGWKFKNLMLRGGDAGAILIIRTLEAETTEKGFAGDHATFEGCTFQGGAFGICQEGGIFGVKIRSCMFRLMTTGTALLGKTGEGVGYPLFWDIRDNWFVGNHQDISAALSCSVITNNIFHSSKLLTPNGISSGLIDLTNGIDNIVENNLERRF